MKSISAKQMRELDRLAIEEYGIPGLTLMENAGKGVADFIDANQSSFTKITVISGVGNNGGDGFVIARLLSQKGYVVQLAVVGDVEKLSEDAKANFGRIENENIVLSVFDEEEEISGLSPLLEESDVIVDALFGIGLARDLKGKYLAAVEAINSVHGKRVVSVDIPSGLNADTGIVQGDCVQADQTLTFGLPKKGMFLGEGPKMCGEISVVDIGLPQEEIDNL